MGLIHNRSGSRYQRVTEENPRNHARDDVEKVIFDINPEYDGKDHYIDDYLHDGSYEVPQEPKNRALVPSAYLPFYHVVNHGAVFKNLADGFEHLKHS